MTRKPARKLGPIHHGQPITNADLGRCEFVSGFRYEVIEGKLYVSVWPTVAEVFIEDWLDDRLTCYSKRRTEALNYVANKARVYVHACRRETIPEPDLTAYRGLPLHLPLSMLHWKDFSPILVAEIFSGCDAEKDLIRNPKLYLRVPTIREYWIIDISEDADRPTMYVYRRRGKKWQQPIEVRYGETYTTKLLPGFELLLDPKS